MGVLVKACFLSFSISVAFAAVKDRQVTSDSAGPVHVVKFNETCCEENGVPEQCMGLCREQPASVGESGYEAVYVQPRSDSSITHIYPIAQCEQHFNDVQSCQYEAVVNHCTFSNGDVKGGREEYLDMTNSENECASLVIAQRSSATGATWSHGNRKCWAEFGDHIATPSNYRACLFNSAQCLTKPTTGSTNDIYEANKPCVFPFTYGDRIYNACRDWYNEHWCATTDDYQTDRKWGYCNNNCPTTTYEGGLPLA